MAVVEVGIMHVRPGKTPMLHNTPDGELLDTAWSAVVTAPGGPGAVYWGLEEGGAGSEGRLWGFFEWENLEQHVEFAKSFGGEATKNFGQVFTPGFTKHASLNATILTHSPTQVHLLSFPSGLTQTSKDAVQKHAEVALSELRNPENATCGWGLEDDFPLAGGEVGSLFFALVGCAERDGVKEEEDKKEGEMVRESLRRIAESEGAVAVDAFQLRCEVLERKSEL